MPSPSDWSHSSSTSLAYPQRQELICLVPSGTSQRWKLLPLPHRSGSSTRGNASVSDLPQIPQRVFIHFPLEWDSWRLGDYIYSNAEYFFTKYFDDFYNHSSKMDLFFIAFFKRTHWIPHNLSLIIQSHNHVHQWLHCDAMTGYI